MMKSIGGTVALIALVAISGCQSVRFGGSQANQAPQQAAVNPASAVNGRWEPTDDATRGVYVAEFRDGVFVSRSPETGKPLARGSYRVPSDSLIELDFVGATTQTRVTATCQRSTPTTMFCQPSTGSPFNLRKV